MTQASKTKGAKGRPLSIHPDRPATSAERASRSIQALKKNGGERKTLYLPNQVYVDAWQRLLDAAFIKNKHAHHLIIETACRMHGLNLSRADMKSAVDKAIADLGKQHPITLRLIELAAAKKGK